MSDSLGDRLWQYFREGPPDRAGFPEFFLASVFWWRPWAFIALAVFSNVVIEAGWSRLGLGIFVVGLVALAITK